MRRMALTLGTIVLMAGFLAACGSAGSAPRSAADLRLIGQHTVEVGGQSAQGRLSPDGQWLALLIERRRLCLYATDTLAEKHCVELNSRPVSAVFLWSPDSQRIALTDEFRVLFKSNLWVYDVGMDQLAQWTSDDNATNAFPVWSPDSQALLFQHSTSDGDLSVYRVSTTGGTPTKVLDAENVFGGPMIWSTKGQIVFTPLNGGLWVVGADGQNMRQVLSKVRRGDPLWRSQRFLHRRGRFDEWRNAAAYAVDG
jgi:dipeptidyl aminopeptidase/acylaminoacyl peptidase